MNYTRIAEIVLTILLKILAKAIYFKNKLESTTNSKEGWRTINLLLNKKSKSTLINELKIGDSIVKPSFH